MEIKNTTVLPIGINRDSGNSIFPEDKLYDAFNIKFLAQKDNSSFIIQNERGNLLCELNTPILGYINGSCSTDDSVVIFTTTKVTEETTPSIDRIYKVVKNDDDSYTNYLLFQGNLNLCLTNPIQTLYNYETQTVKKVYWTDNRNSPRYININLNDTITDAKKFEFVSEFNLKSIISVTKNPTGGTFTAGTIQYAISYYYKYGAETNLFDISPVAYISHADRGGKPGETVGCSFTLEISNIDTSFDFLRIYTIERSSVDKTPICRKIDININDSINIGDTTPTIKIIDNGQLGTTVAADELLFIGGESILLGTIISRENTFFGGNFTIQRPTLKEVKPLLDFNTTNFTWYRGSILDIENPESGKSIYGYEPISLNEINTKRRYFKNNEYYRIGFQAQYKTGRWSEVLYLGEDYKCNLPISLATDLDTPSIKFAPVIGKFTLSLQVISKLKELGYVAIRPVFVQPTLNDKRAIAQGLISNTISYGLELGNIAAYSDYILRTNVHYEYINSDAMQSSHYFYNPNNAWAFPQGTAGEKNLPLHFSQEHYAPILSSTASTVSSEHKTPDLYPKNNETVLTWDPLATYTSSGIGSSTNTTLNRFKEFDVYCENISWTVFPSIFNTNIGHVTYSFSVDGIVNSGFYVNESIVDFFSPDFEFHPESDYLTSEGMKLNIVGTIPFTSSTYSDELFISSTANNMIYDPLQTHQEFITEFKEYQEDEYNYTTSQGRTKVAQAIGIRCDGSEGTAAIDNIRSLIVPAWSRQKVLVVADGDKYSGATSIVRKSVGHFNYSAFNRYFNNDYIKELEINKPVPCRYESNTSMLYTIYDNSNNNSVISAGFNRIFSNPEDITKSTFVKYKTAPHWAISFKPTTFDNYEYLTVLPSLKRRGETIWYLEYPDINKVTYTGGDIGVQKYIKLPIVEDVVLQQVNPVFSDNKLPLNGETYCFLGEITRDTNYSCFGGQKLISGTYQEVLRILENEVYATIPTFPPAPEPPSEETVEYPLSGYSTVSSQDAWNVASGSYFLYGASIYKNLADNKVYDEPEFRNLVSDGYILKYPVSNTTIWNDPLNIYYQIVDGSIVGDNPTPIEEYEEYQITGYSNTDIRDSWDDAEEQGFIVISTIYRNVGDNLFYKTTESTEITNLVNDGYYLLYPAGSQTDWTDASNIYYYLVDGAITEGSTTIQEPRLLEDGGHRVLEQYSLIEGTGRVAAIPSALMHNIWIPCGDRVFIDESLSSVDVVCNIGDTYLQRYDLVKSCPITTTDDSGNVSISSSDYQTHTSVVSFLVESTINLDGRYDVNRKNPYVHNVTSDNYNKLNLVYSQANNFFTFRGLDYEEFSTNIFKNSFTWSGTKLPGEFVDTWTRLNLTGVYDCDGALGQITSFQPLGMYLIGFQKNGIFNVLHNTRTAISSNDGVPIELASIQGVSGIRYITTTTGVTHEMCTAVSPKGIYFIDVSNKYIGRYNSDGIVNLSESKGIKSWCNTNISAKQINSFYNSQGFAIYVDQINGLVYFVNTQYCLIYSEALELFMGFYSYEGMTGLYNIWGEVYTIDRNANLYIQNLGLYNHYFGVYQPSSFTLISNPDSLVDKTFNWFEMNLDAFSSRANTKRITEDEDYRITEDGDKYRMLETTGDIYLPNVFLNTIEVSTEYQQNEVPLNYHINGNVHKKFRKWRVEIPREKNTINRFRNNWLKTKYTYTPNENDNIRFNLYNIGLYYTIH